MWGFGKVQCSWPIWLCLIPFQTSFPSSTPNIVSMLLLEWSVDREVDVGIGAVVCDMSELAFGMFSMVIDKFGRGLSTLGFVPGFCINILSLAR